MPKYDAFGREIGEDTLQGLGNTSQPETDWRASAWPTADEVRSEPQPVEAPPAPAEAPSEPVFAQPEPSAPAAPQRPTFVRPGSEDAQRTALASQLSGVLSQAAAARAAGTPVRRRSAGRGCLVIVVALVVIFTGLAVLGAIVDSVDKTVRSVPKIKVPEAIQPKPAPKGLAPRSLVRRANLAAALTQIRTKGGGRLTHLRVAPERIDAQLLTSAGRLRSVQVKPGEPLERLGPDSGPGFDQSSTIPFSRINPAAPQRLARAGAERIGVPVADLQYVVPTNFNGSLMWAAYFTRGRYVIGDASGRFQRKYP